jgi:Na+/H+ antiporter NhaA
MDWPMNPIALLTNGINDLWIWTYSIIAGWGVTMTVIIAIMTFCIVRLCRVEAKLSTLENHLVQAERDFNLTVNNWKNK